MPSAAMPTPAPAIAALVLAAGQASRFGSDKRRAQLPGQPPLLVQCVSLAAQVCDQVWVTLRPDDQLAVASLLGDWFNNPRIHPQQVTNADQGMGTSLAAGVAAILDWQQQRDKSQSGVRLRGVMVLLADMPYIQTDTLQTLINAHSADCISYPCYTGDSPVTRGHPVIFGRPWLTELSQLSGDNGGKSVLAAHPEAHNPVPVADLGILRDVDRPADLR